MEDHDRPDVDPRFAAISSLDAAILEALAKPLPLSVPRRVFVSYRRGVEGPDAWVQRLVAELEKRGNTVLFDHQELSGRSSTEDVAKFVAAMASCHVFLAVLDEGYGERVGHGRPEDPAPRLAMRTTMFHRITRQILGGVVSQFPSPGHGPSQRLADGWVWDELQTALRLAHAGRCLPMGVLRAGERVPTGFVLVTEGGLGNAWDGRTEEGLIRGLDALFHQIAPSPSESQARQATRLLNDSANALNSGNPRKALDCAGEVIRCVGRLPDGHIARARAAFQIPNYDVAFNSATQALRKLPYHSEMRLMAGESARQLGRPRQTVELVSGVARWYPGDWRAQATLGNALDDLGQAYAGIARLELARRLRPTVSYISTDLGVAYKNIAEQAKALASFERAKEALLAEIGETKKGGGADRRDALANVLVNIAATCLQARDDRGGRQALGELAQRFPRHPAIPHLTKRLDDWLAGGRSGVPLPVVRTSSQVRWLDSQPVPRSSRRCAKCTGCEACIPVIDETHTLCVQCGAERQRSEQPCAYCACEKWVALEQGSRVPCPYCRRGELSVGRC